MTIDQPPVRHQPIVPVFFTYWSLVFANPKNTALACTGEASAQLSELILAKKRSIKGWKTSVSDPYVTDLQQVMTDVRIEASLLQPEMIALLATVCIAVSNSDRMTIFAIRGSFAKKIGANPHVSRFQAANFQ